MYAWHNLYVEVMECLAILANNKLSYFDLKRKQLYENNSTYWSKNFKKIKKQILLSFYLN